MTALKYETPMFYKFITCFSDNSYISSMGLCMCFIFFALLDPVLSVIAMQIFDFKNSIIAIIYFYDFKSVFNISMIFKVSLIVWGCAPKGISDAYLFT